MSATAIGAGNTICIWLCHACAPLRGAVGARLHIVAVPLDTAELSESRREYCDAQRARGGRPEEAGRNATVEEVAKGGGECRGSGLPPSGVPTESGVLWAEADQHCSKKGW